MRSSTAPAARITLASRTHRSSTGRPLEFAYDNRGTGPERACRLPAIGSYKLLEQIGEGGFGVVFMAEQTQPVRRKVALEGPQAGHGHAAGHRPLRGRAAGAGADGPPNIAQVLDGGADRLRPALLRHGTGPRHAHHRVLRPESSDDPRAAGAVRRRLPGGAARPSEGDHPPRPQAVQRAGDAARWHAGGQGDRLRRRQGDRAGADRQDAVHRASRR